MKGLLKNNLYASFANIKWFLAFMLPLGLLAAVMKNDVRDTLLVRYLLINVICFSVISFSGLGKENDSKWQKYKLTMPLKRSDIVKSYYVNHIVWLLASILFTAFWLVLSTLLKGFPFDKSTDPLMLFTFGISVSMLIGAFFFPLFFLGGSERYEAIWTICIFCAIGCFLGMTFLVNVLFEPMTEFRLVLSAILIIIVSICIFVLSFPLSVRIFSKKEY